ncbi:hypothetical protein RINTHH_6380 [Richelia intracellularis HH01]|uniref:Uncharacterized protein n=1 Tax=Richelia intracellularis HH01 TaxID=1165094 RepID=M1WZH0_9NOST|nr:hypothetical protein RINTHH_6380 [Richelia intracellularis HH01]
MYYRGNFLYVYISTNGLLVISEADVLLGLFGSPIFAR